MTYYPSRIKICDDILFIKLHRDTSATYRCIHLPTLVVTAQLPGEPIDLTENAFSPLPPECKLEAYGSVRDEICSIPSCLPKHPRYCFILTRYLENGEVKYWEILEVEIDLSMPGPIKIFSRVSRQNNVACPANIFHHSVEDLLLSVPVANGHGYINFSSLKVRFLQVGRPNGWREVKLEIEGKKKLAVLHVDRDAGYITASVKEGWDERSQACYFIWWIDVRKPGAYGTVKDLSSGWSHGPLWSV